MVDSSSKALYCAGHHIYSITDGLISSSKALYCAGHHIYSITDGPDSSSKATLLCRSPHIQYNWTEGT